MRRKFFICFLVLFISIIVFYSTRQNNLKAAGFEENEMIDKSTSEKIEEYKKLLDKLAKSNYTVVEGKLVRKSKLPKLSVTEEKEIKIISKALEGIKGKLSVPEGAKVIVESHENRYVVIFETKLPKGAIGSSSFKVIIDSKSEEVLEILEGPN